MRVLGYINYGYRPPAHNDFLSPYVLYGYYSAFSSGGIVLTFKIITLKVFGAKAYEVIGVAATIGLVAGMALMATIIMGL